MTDAGRKIIDGLKDAVAGNFSRVTIDGQVWVRADNAPAQIQLTDAEERLTRLMDEAWPAGHRAMARRILENFAVSALPSTDSAQRPTEPHETTYLRGWNEAVETAAEIAEPWAGYWLDKSSTDADRAVVAVRTEIAAKIRALSVTSTMHGTPESGGK